MSAADRRLGDALVAEYAAIFGYGAAGAHLPPTLVAQAQQDELAHRQRRDALLVRLGDATAGDASSPPPSAQAGYVLPFPVTDAPSAVRLATALEERAAAIWRQALPDTDGDSRKLALDALVDCALRAARWRRAGGARPGVVPLPGAPV